MNHDKSSLSRDTKITRNDQGERFSFAANKSLVLVLRVMEFALSWDIVFGALLAITFLVILICSHRFTLRVVLGTYTALILSEAVALTFDNVFVPMIPELQNWVSENDLYFYMVVRLVIFLAILILFVLKGHYHVHHKEHGMWLMRAILHFLFAVIASGLVIITLFVFMSGESVIDALLGTFAPIDWFDASTYIPMAVEYYGIWLLLPAVGMVLNTIFGGSQD